MMRSSKETGCFPYSSKTVCYIEVFPNGDIHQLVESKDKINAYFNAKSGESRILAVWPGHWKIDLFIIDDLEAYSNEQNLIGKYESTLLSESRAMNPQGGNYV